MAIYRYILASYIVLLALIQASAGLAAGGQQTLVRTQILMGTVPVTISLDFETGQRPAAQTALSAAFTLARRLEATVGSDPELRKRADEIGRLTAGYFDLRFGLGGIAKGTIVDRMAEQLRKQGYPRFLINAGGDLWAESPDDQAPWEIASAGLVANLCVHRRAIASSGTSERGHHIINPKTGRPVQSGDQSVTVLASRTETADALATALFAAGSNRAQIMRTLLEHDPTLTFIVIDAAGRVDISGSSDIGCKIHEEL